MALGCSKGVELSKFAALWSVAQQSALRENVLLTGRPEALVADFNCHAYVCARQTWRRNEGALTSILVLPCKACLIWLRT